MNRPPRLLSSASPQGRAARVVMRGCSKAALATAMPADGSLRPYVSLVTVAFDHDGTPLLLLSRLADHTRNILADSRASLLFDATAGHANPQEGPRVTLVGRVEVSAERRHRRRFLARHPAAAQYAGFADFAFYRFVGEAAHFVGGFARACWIRGPLTVAQAAGWLDDGEGEMLRRLNEETPGLAADCAAQALGRAAGPWAFAGLDPDGADLVLGEERARLDFGETVADARAIEAALARLAAESRGR